MLRRRPGPGRGDIRQNLSGFARTNVRLWQTCLDAVEDGCYSWTVMAKPLIRMINGVYENGTIRFRAVKLGRKLPLRNRTVLHFRLELPKGPASIALQTFGILRVPKRLARLVAESPEFSVLNS